MVGSESSTNVKDIKRAWKVVEKAAENFAAKSVVEGTAVPNTSTEPVQSLERKTEDVHETLMKKTSPITISKQYHGSNKLYQEPLLQMSTPVGSKRHFVRKKLGSPPILPPLGSAEKVPIVNLVSTSAFSAERDSIDTNGPASERKKGMLQSFGKMNI